MAFRANDGVFTFRFRKSEDGAALLTLSVNMSFSIAPFIFAKLKEIQKFLIFRVSFGDISRHRSEDNNADERPRNEKIADVDVFIFLDEKENYHIRHDERRVAPQKSGIKFIRTVSAVHKAIQRVFYLAHYSSPITLNGAPQRDPSWMRSSKERVPRKV